MDISNNMAQNVFRLKETGDLFTFKNGVPLLLQMGTQEAKRSGINPANYPSISVEDAAKRFMPRAYPSAFFDFAQTASPQDILEGGDPIKTVTPQEERQLFAQRRQENLAYETSQQTPQQFTQVTAPLGSAERTKQLLEASQRFAPGQNPNLGQDTTPAPLSDVSATGDPQYDAILKELQAVLQNLQAKGQAINPNIDISKERMAEFLKISESETNPYYARQLKLARESLLSSVGYKKEEILQSEKNLESKYRTQVRQIGEESAERGFAQSGQRVAQERQLASATQQDIESQRKQFGFESENLAKSFAQQYGTEQLPSFNIPEVPRVFPGEGAFKTSERTLPLYNLSSDVYEGLTGQKEFERRGAVRARTSQQEEAERTLGAIGQQRKLTF